jgi:RNA 3'-terminal phosphate cyclase (ATP)
MGARVEARLGRYGFAPAGGGRFVVEIEGGCELSAIDLCESGELRSRCATALACQLPGTIAIRELRAVREILDWKNEECLPKVFDESNGPGNMLLLEMNYEQLTELISVVGERNVSAEEVAAMAARKLERYLEHGAPVGPYLADQLVLAFALAGGGSFRTGPLTRHALTNIEVVNSFLDTRIERTPRDGGSLVVSFARNRMPGAV